MTVPSTPTQSRRCSMKYSAYVKASTTSSLITISTKNTEVMYQPILTVKWQNLQAVDPNLIHLGSNGGVHWCWIQQQDCLGQRRLRKTPWEFLKVHRAVILTSLLYAWNVYSRNAKQLNHCHLSFLRIFLLIRWQEKNSWHGGPRRGQHPNVYTLLQKVLVIWTGHISRMPENRLTKQLLYGEHCQGKLSVEGRRNFLKTASESPSKRPGLSIADTTSSSVISTWSSCLHRHLHSRWRDK